MQNAPKSGIQRRQIEMFVFNGCEGLRFVLFREAKEPKKNRWSLSFAVLRIFGTSADLIGSSALSYRLLLLYMLCCSHASLSGARTKERQRQIKCRWRCARKRLESVIVRRISYKENRNLNRITVNQTGERHKRFFFGSFFFSKKKEPFPIRLLLRILPALNPLT